MKKTNFFILLIFFLSVIFIFVLSNFVFAAYPQLVNTIATAFDKIKTWIIRIATPAAAVAVRDWRFYEKV